MKGVYEKFGLPMPVIYPRKSVTIVEKKIDHILAKYGLEIPDLWARRGRDHRGHRPRSRFPMPLDKALRLRHAASRGGF